MMPTNGVAQAQANYATFIEDLEEQGTLNGRTVTTIAPVSYADRGNHKASGGISIGLVLLVGGVMWGVCANPEKDGCNQAVLEMGRAFTYIALGSIGLGVLANCLCGCK